VDGGGPAWTLRPTHTGSAHIGTARRGTGPLIWGFVCIMLWGSGWGKGGRTRWGISSTFSTRRGRRRGNSTRTFAATTGTRGTFGWAGACWANTLGAATP